MTDLPLKLWTDDTGQDAVEYAVMLAMILVLVVGTISLVGSNANNASPRSPAQFSKPRRAERNRIVQVRKQFTFRLLMDREACSSHDGPVHGTQREELMLESRRSFLRTQQCRHGMRAST